MEEKVYEYNPVTSSTEILNEIKYILETNKNVDEDSNYTPVTLDESCISLASVYTCIKNERLRFDNTNKVFKMLIEESIKKHFGENSLTVLHEINFDTNELSISFKKDKYEDYKEIIFSKYNDDIYLKRSESTYGQEIFRIIYEIISNAFNELMKFKNYYQEANYYINSMNSNFIVDISHYGVDICDSRKISPKFKLRKTSYDDNYACECNSAIVLNTVKGIEDEILKFTFVKIEDCPSWMKASLHEMRKKELLEQKQAKNKIINEKEEENQKEKTNIKSKFRSLFKRTKK